MMRAKSTEQADILKLLRTCQKRLEKDPEDADAWFSKGLVLAKLKKYKQAIYCLNRVTRIQRDYPSVWRLKATVYALMGDQWMSRLCKIVAKRQEVDENIISIGRMPAIRTA